MEMISLDIFVYSLSLRCVNLKRRCCPRCWKQNSSAQSERTKKNSSEKITRKVFFFSRVVQMRTSSSSCAVLLLLLLLRACRVLYPRSFAFSSDTFLRHEGPRRVEQRNDGEGIKALVVWSSKACGQIAFV